MFNVNYLLIKTLNIIYLIYICEESVKLFSMCVNASNYDCLMSDLTLGILYFAPPPNIWLNYQSTIGKIWFDYENP